MSNRNSVPTGTHYTVIDVIVPTFAGDVVRPATVAWRRASSRIIHVGAAICNQDTETFSADAGRDIATGRLVKRPIILSTEASTIDGIESALRRGVTVSNIRSAGRRH